MGVLHRMAEIFDKRAPLFVWRFRSVRHYLRWLRATPPPVFSCPICGFEGYFGPFGPARPYSACPACGGRGRHRLMKLWFDAARPSPRKALHFSPERAERSFVKAVSNVYVASTLSGKGADLSIDIEDIDLPDESFDLIVCNHVLEHISDDKRALGELHRVLTDDGVLLLTVPICEGWKHTFEDRTAIHGAQRLLLFGQGDHVRYYGADFRDRVRAAGFTIEEFTATEPSVSRYGLNRGEKIFICRKEEPRQGGS